MIGLHFSGASDDLLHLSTSFGGESGPEHVFIITDGTDSQDLDEISAITYRGWLVTPDAGRPFAVWALLGPMGPQWHFAVGFPPGTDEDDGADIGMLSTTVRQSPTTPYSTELTIMLTGRCTVEAIPGKAEGA